MRTQHTIQTTLGDEVVFVAETQLDVREEGKNAGPEVARYLKSVGLGTGYAWCMGFVYWVVAMACKRLSIAVHPLVKTGGVLDQYNRCTLRKVPAQSWNAVGPGDIFIMDLGKGQGHTGIVIKIEKGIVYTIEGNTNDEGSREGIEVCRRQRSLSEIKAFILLP